MTCVLKHIQNHISITDVAWSNLIKQRVALSDARFGCVLFTQQRIAQRHAIFRQVHSMHQMKGAAVRLLMKMYSIHVISIFNICSIRQPLAHIAVANPHLEIRHAAEQLSVLLKLIVKQIVDVQKIAQNLFKKAICCSGSNRNLSCF